MKKCFFVGHSDSIGIENKINAELAKIIKYGEYEFYSGGMGNFDKMCEKAVKEQGGKITFVPYNVSIIKEKDKQWYDSIVCPFGNKPYTMFDISKRNKWAVEQCDLIFSYVFKNGGARHTLDYAESKNKRIMNLYFL